MKLSELKTGMRVFLRNGDEAVVFKNMDYRTDYDSNIFLDFNGRFTSFEVYTEDMKDYEGFSNLDIMKVYRIKDNYNVMTKLSELRKDDYELIYEREEPPVEKLTKSQIEALLGYKIEIVESED